MSKTPTDETPSDAQAVAEVEAAPPEPEPEPEPEPWTPERVLEWNRYYDLYVAAGVLVLVFLAGAHKVLNPGLWSMLQTGRLAASQGWPVTRDPFSFSAQGRAWVDLSWLFGLVNALIHDLAYGLIFDPNNREQILRAGSLVPRAEQVAAGVLVGLNATIRALTALVLLNIRRPGPGLWWAAIGAAWALGGMIMPNPSSTTVPFTISLGGLAGVGDVDPGTWGLLLLALELAAIHAATNLGRRNALYALPVLFLVWVNVDETFLLGLVVLAMAVLGSVRRPSGAELTVGRGLIVLGASAGACLINPAFHGAYVAALKTWLDILPGAGGELVADQISFFGRESGRFLRNRLGANTQRLYIAHFLIVVGVVLATFVLNRRRFNLGRLLMVVVGALAWAALRRYSGEFAVIGAMAATLNGQEWFLDRHGDRGHLDRGWAVWSVGGRAVTLIAIFAMIVKGLTGYAATPEEVPVGFGVTPWSFPFEAADALKRSPIRGNVLNLSPAQGDAVIWRTWPADPKTWAANPGRRVYIDNRRNLYDRGIRDELRRLRAALRSGDVAAWKPILDKYDASAIVFPIGNEARIYEALSRSPEWIEFHDDGHIVMFGRADARPEDVAYFQQQRLDAEGLVYRGTRPVPSNTQPPTPVSWLDRVFRSRAMVEEQPHVRSGGRWLGVRRGGQDAPIEPAHFLMAIRESRRALAAHPDDTYALRLLSEAYKFLAVAEAEILAEQPDADPTEFLLFRYRQRVAALNHAILTTPPPITEDERRVLGTLHLQLAEMYRGVNIIDLESNHLEAARKLLPSDEQTDALAQRLEQLNDEIGRIEVQLEDLETTQSNPLAVVEAAQQQGMVGYAIAKLETIEEFGVNPETVKARLVDLYIQTGQPDRSFEQMGTIEDPALATGPGTSAYRQGLVSLLIGDYDNAATLWDKRAIPAVVGTRVSQALAASRGLARGEPKSAAQDILDLPGLAGTESAWEAELGMCLLESGYPDEAAEHFTRALTIQPKSPIRPLLAYYLKKIGRDVPAEPDEAATAATPAETPKAELPSNPFETPR